MAQWDPALLCALSVDRRVVVFDYPGLGGSAALAGRLTFDRLADDAAALLTHVGAVRADVLGWSMGGFVAQRLAVRHPERIRRLVLAATNPGPAAYVRTNYPAGHRAAGRAFVRRGTYAAMVAAEDPWLRSARNLGQLAHVAAPTLVVTGEEDVVTPPANTQLMAATIPGARLVLVPEAGHAFLFQPPTRLETS